MAQIMGFEGRVEYVEETPGAYNTLPYSSTFHWIGDVKKFSIANKIEKKTRYRLRPRGATNKRNPSAIVSGRESTTAKIEWAPQATGTSGENYMSFVGALIGTSTGLADARKSMVINAVHKDGTAEGALIGSVCRYFSAKCGIGEEVMFEAELEAATYDPSAPLDVTSDISGATDVFELAPEGNGEVLDWRDVDIQLSSTSQDMVTDFEFKIDHRAEARYRLHGAGRPGEVTQKTYAITGKLTYDFEDTVELMRMLNKDSFTLAIKIGVFTFTFTGCEWGDDTVDQDVESAVQIPLNFTALSVAVTP